MDAARKLPNIYPSVVLTVCAVLQSALCLIAIHLSSPADGWFIWFIVFEAIIGVALAITHWGLYLRPYIDFRIEEAMRSIQSPLRQADNLSTLQCLNEPVFGGRDRPEKLVCQVSNAPGNLS